MDLTVSITNTNRASFLRQCLQSLQPQLAGIDAEVYVIENASTDSSASMLAHEFPWVRVVQNSRKQGFADNHNKVLRIAKGEFVLVHTEDVYFLPGALRALLEFMRTHSQVAVAGPAVVRAPQEQGFVGSAYRRYPVASAVLADALVSLTGLRKVLPKQWIASMLMGLGPAEMQQRVAHVDGCSFMLRRSILGRAGLFSPEFTFFYGETDFCFRVQRAGGEIWYVPAARVAHYGTPPTSVSRRRASLMRQSVSRFLLKNYGRSAALRFDLVCAALWPLQEAHNLYLRVRYRNLNPVIPPPSYH